MSALTFGNRCFKNTLIISILYKDVTLPPLSAVREEQIVPLEKVTF